MIVNAIHIIILIGAVALLGTSMNVYIVVISYIIVFASILFLASALPSVNYDQL